MQNNELNVRWDVMSKRKLAMVLSLVLVLGSIAALAIRGLNFGVDFTGGYLIEVGYSEAVELAPVRSALSDGGFGDALVQHFGTAKDVLVRLAPRAGRHRRSPTEILDKSCPLPGFKNQLPMLVPKYHESLRHHRRPGLPCGPTVTRGPRRRPRVG